MTLKTLGMGAVKFLKTVAGKGTQARNKASAKFFEKYSGKKNVDKLFELEKKLKIKAKSRRIEKEIESKTGKK